MTLIQDLGYPGWNKLDPCFIHTEFARCGCQLLDEKYKDSSTPMQYKCVCGTISKISWDNFKAGHRCLNCNKSKRKTAHIKTVKSLVGKQFGLWTIDKFIEQDAKGNYVYEMTCKNCSIKKIRSRVGWSGYNKCNNCFGKPKGETGLKKLYSCRTREALRANRVFNLSLEEFRAITKSTCHYCGKPPEQVFKIIEKDEAWSHYVYNGVDRKDNSKGYTLENCVPCCWICNRAKGGYSYEFFMDYLNRITNFRRTQ